MKNGLDYFSLDVIFDTKMKLIEAEFGLDGFAVIVKLLQKIYGEDGYYCEWTNEVGLLFAMENHAGASLVSEIVVASINRGIFDKGMYDKYSILTSKGIQKRYFEAVKRRVSVDVKKQYLLVSDTSKIKNVNIIEENVNTSSENVHRNQQSKVKESKVKKSKIYSPTSDKPKMDTSSVKEIIDYLNLKAGTAFRASSAATAKLVKARQTDGFVIDDFKKVIDNKCTEWMGDPKMQQYLRPETLFGTKFEAYLNQKVANAKPVKGKTGMDNQSFVAPDTTSRFGRRVLQIDNPKNT